MFEQPESKESAKNEGVKRRRDVKLLDGKGAFRLRKDGPALMLANCCESGSEFILSILLRSLLPFRRLRAPIGLQVRVESL